MNKEYQWVFNSTHGQGTLYNQTHEVIGKVMVVPYNKDVLDIIQTYVDPKFRGHGIGEQLLISLLEDESLKNYKFKPTCSYAVIFFEKHVEYRNRLYEGK